MKYNFIYAHRNEHSIVKMCVVLNISKSGYYKWLNKKDNGPTEREQYRSKIKQKIKQSFHESFGTYGSPRVHNDLVEWGYTVSLKTVARIMQEMRLKATPEEKYVITTDSNHDLYTYPNLLNQNFNVGTPNEVWVADITYIWTLEGWVIWLLSLTCFQGRLLVGVWLLI